MKEDLKRHRLKLPSGGSGGGEGSGSGSGGKTALAEVLARWLWDERIGLPAIEATKQAKSKGKATSSEDGESRVLRGRSEDLEGGARAAFLEEVIRSKDTWADAAADPRIAADVRRREAWAKEIFLSKGEETKTKMSSADNE